MQARAWLVRIGCRAALTVANGRRSRPLACRVRACSGGEDVKPPVAISRLISKKELLFQAFIDLSGAGRTRYERARRIHRAITSRRGAAARCPLVRAPR